MANDKYLKGFSSSSSQLQKKLSFVTKNKTTNESDFFEELMITLIESDVGYQTAKRICDEVYKKAKWSFFLDINKLMKALYDVFESIYNEFPDSNEVINQKGPTVTFLVGVNGSGKTSTCAKLANKYKNEGKRVAVVAADTFRAGATEQLEQWALKVNVPIIKGKEGQDPSSVLVDGCRYAKENNIDILLCDTAGRLQNKTNLMNELAKMIKVVGKEIENAPHNLWLVLDANTGQNGISQAALFNEITRLTGIILTKMDGTSKGGIVIAIKNIFRIPVRYLGLGEKVDDLEKFDIKQYLNGMLQELKDVT